LRPRAAPPTAGSPLAIDLQLAQTRSTASDHSQYHTTWIQLVRDHWVTLSIQKLMASGLSVDVSGYEQTMTFSRIQTQTQATLCLGLESTRRRPCRAFSCRRWLLTCVLNRDCRRRARTGVGCCFTTRTFAFSAPARCNARCLAYLHSNIMLHACFCIDRSCFTHELKRQSIPST